MSSESREIMHDQHSHPVGATRTYWIIGVILILATVVEVGAYAGGDMLGSLANPLVMVVSAAKFILVVMFFMHLKYDSKVFTGVFIFPMALATLVIGGLWLLYHVVHPLR
jgi:cytochrome c oxidase subunit IV